MDSVFFRLVALDFAIQNVCFIVAALLQTELFYDLSGSITFIVMTCYSLTQSTIDWENYKSLAKDRRCIISFLIVVWAARLGLFLFSRILKSGKDRRFDKVRTRPFVFAIFWNVQALWIFLTSLPVLMVNSIQKQPQLQWLDYFGIALWFVGIWIEAIADAQKREFRSVDPKNNKWIETGLWRYSRHPNYFGEILLWIGMAIIAFNVATTPMEVVVASLSPLFVTFLLTKVSGIPMLEKMNDKQWANDKDYQKYKKRTSILIPFPRVASMEHCD